MNGDHRDSRSANLQALHGHCHHAKTREQGDYLPPGVRDKHRDTEERSARKRHAPFWNSGRRSDPPTDCNRVNLTIRQHVAAIGRRVTTLCKGEDGVRQRLVLYLMPTFKGVWYSSEHFAGAREYHTTSDQPAVHHRPHRADPAAHRPETSPCCQLVSVPSSPEKRAPGPQRRWEPLSVLYSPAAGAAGSADVTAPAAGAAYTPGGQRRSAAPRPQSAPAAPATPGRWPPGF
jgi:hypothetical protein